MGLVRTWVSTKLIGTLCMSVCFTQTTMCLLDSGLSHTVVIKCFWILILFCMKSKS